MTDRKEKIELLAPAGNFEKLDMAIHYGADAVYLADKHFSLRNFSGNFTVDEIKEAVAYAHDHNVKVYVACNIYSRNFEQKAISDYLGELGDIKPDAVIMSDPGILMMAGEIIPDIPIHLSTQANTTSINSVLFWEKFGVKRVNLARELSLDEISEIANQCSAEIEVFVHGAMCMSYSGRCLLSSFLTKRDSNRGACSHPCRWSYSVVEELRPGEYMPVAEDERGTYIFNSKDLCMIEHIPALVKANISSLKIEGRMKSINYVASTVKVYREAIDAYYDCPDTFRVKDEWLDQLLSIGNRDYCTGFFLNDPDQVVPNYSHDRPLEGHLFIGKVLESAGGKKVTVDVRNKLYNGDNVEIICKKRPLQYDKIEDIIDESGQSVPFAQPGSKVTILFNNDYMANDLIRTTDTGE